MSIVAGAAALAAILAGGCFALIWKLLAATTVQGVDPDWLRNYSVSSYRPMERLLDERDVAFLQSHPGYEANMEKKLRADRRRVFRMYLRNLGRDFNRLHHALRLLALHSPQDNPELAKTLIRQKFVFFAGYLAARVKLELYAAGIGSVDVRGLVSTLDTMHTELHGLLSTPMAPAAAS